VTLSSTSLDESAFLDVLVLANWNTRVVVLGVMTLGIAGGVVGTFMLLRRRALLGDALSHATLPGIVLAFLVASALGVGGKSHGILLLGALLSGILGIVAVHWLTRSGRLSEDSALGVVLSTFFGAGAALLGLAQQETSASAAGLETFIYGKTASMLVRDAVLFGAISITAIGCCVVFFKELRLICFDPEFARGRGMRTGVYDFLLMSLVMAVVVIGLQAVGLVLVIAILVIPAAAARFWTNATGHMLLAAGFIGGLGGWLGTMLSALAPGLPAGAMVVLALGGIFLVSLLAGRRRGLLRRAIRLRRRALSMERDHALRAVWECLEHSGRSDCLSSQVGFRWGWATIRTAERLQKAGLLVVEALGGDQRITFTPSGEREAASVVRRHRLWEHYLMRRADFDEQHVDRGADELEHLLPIDLLEELEKELDADTRAMLPSPHALRAGEPGGEGP
jgi:manganese/zinc/iron transport system permease protein